MIYLLPGMGANNKMYAGPWHELPESRALDWPEYRGEKTIADMANRVIDEFAIGDGDMVVGTSLGGMVACEIACVRKLRALFLIASAIRKEEINSLLAWLHPLAAVAPVQFMQFSAKTVPHELSVMFVDANPDFIRAMCTAVLDWQGLGKTGADVFRLHGSRDQVIPVPPDVDKVINGGHLLVLTHARECVDFILVNIR
jgi:pimeloyl-ACP methyl ester carboxylesterase